MAKPKIDNPFEDLFSEPKKRKSTFFSKDKIEALKEANKSSGAKSAPVQKVHQSSGAKSAPVQKVHQSSGASFAPVQRKTGAKSAPVQRKTDKKVHQCNDCTSAKSAPVQKVHQYELLFNYAERNIIKNEYNLSIKFVHVIQELVIILQGFKGQTSLKNIIEKTGYSRRGLLYILEKIEGSGAIVIHKNKGKLSEYNLENVHNSIGTELAKKKKDIYIYNKSNISSSSIEKEEKIENPKRRSKIDEMKDKYMVSGIKNILYNISKIREEGINHDFENIIRKLQKEEKREEYIIAFILKYLESNKNYSKFPGYLQMVFNDKKFGALVSSDIDKARIFIFDTEELEKMKDSEIIAKYDEPSLSEVQDIAKRLDCELRQTRRAQIQEIIEAIAQKKKIKLKYAK